jgi:site-specific recombinase XerD
MPQARKAAWLKAGIVKSTNGHMFCRSFATHLLESGSDIQTVQKLSGHHDFKSTMIYIHVLISPGFRAVG